MLGVEILSSCLAIGTRNMIFIDKPILCTQAVTAMVQQAMQYIDETPDIETRIKLIKTLNIVSAGKVSI